MRPAARVAVLAAAVCLPLGAALGSYALTGDPGPPVAPAHVRIGNTGPSSAAEPPPPPPTTSKKPSKQKPNVSTTMVVPQPPVVDDDDDGGDDDD